MQRETSNLNHQCCWNEGEVTTSKARSPERYRHPLKPHRTGAPIKTLEKENSYESITE